MDRRLLIVSPHFPPVNAPDMHRVRMSLPYYGEFGWTPTVLTVRPEEQEMPQDPTLLRTIPDNISVSRTGALPTGLTRTVGIRNVAMRGFGHLYREGARLIKSQGVDLVYFSTTMFVSLALGRLWKRKYGVPYVIDIQDPWFSTYYDDKPMSEWPPKYRLARAMHRVLERWTMGRVDGVIAVTDAYVQTLRERYDWLRPEMCATIPFGASERDFDLARRYGMKLERAGRGNRLFRGIYVGRGGADMATAVRILFKALAAGRGKAPRFVDVALSFFGTDYADGERARKSLEPIAEAERVASQVSESTARVGYLDTLSLLNQADFLVVIGSDDPQYSPSKIYPYILARKPILAIVHEQSPIADLIRKTRSGIVTTFTGRGDIEAPARQLVGAWGRLLDDLPFAPDIDWAAFAPYNARSLTRQQCLVFDAVAGHEAERAAAS